MKETDSLGEWNLWCISHPKCQLLEYHSSEELYRLTAGNPSKKDKLVGFDEQYAIHIREWETIPSAISKRRVTTIEWNQPASMTVTMSVVWSSHVTGCRNRATSPMTDSIVLFARDQTISIDRNQSILYSIDQMRVVDEILIGYYYHHRHAHPVIDCTSEGVQKCQMNLCIHIDA